jgi:histidinol dehydrogenase
VFLLCGFDLLSQAEHGTDSQVILVYFKKLIDAVEADRKSNRKFTKKSHRRKSDSQFKN